MEWRYSIVRGLKWKKVEQVGEVVQCIHLTLMMQLNMGTNTEEMVFHAQMTSVAYF